MIAVSGKKICRTKKLMLSLLSTLTREYREVWSLPLTLVGMVGQKNVFDGFWLAFVWAF
jgi:hypothetical protein